MEISVANIASKVAELIEYLSDPQNAAGMWLLGTAAIISGYLIGPGLFAL